MSATTPLRPVSTRLRGIMRALREEADRLDEFGRPLEASALRHYHEMLSEVRDQALEEEAAHGSR